MKSVDKPVLIAFGFILVLLVAGSLYSSNFLSATYLLQQLQVASFLGIIASGVMLVILLGHIDLSIPWVVTVGGMMSTAAAGWWGDAGRRALRSRSPCSAASIFGLAERPRRRLPAHPLDDLHARHERGRPGAHGAAHRRLRAPGPRDRLHALAGDRAHPGHPERAVRLARGRRWSWSSS